MMKATCRELVDSVIRDDMDEAGRARIARHLQRCESCAEQARARAAVSAAVLAKDDHLDDLTRTRVLARLGQTIDEVAARRAGKRGKTAGAPVRWAWASGFAVVAAAAILMGWHSFERPPVGPPPAPQLAAQTSVSSPVLPDDTGRVLTPYAVEGAETPHDAQLGKARDRLALPAHATMRAHLAERADLTLVGPLELAVTSASRELVVLDLVRGTLVGDYDGTRGGTLRVRSGDVTVDVVGTLFTVETSAAGTQVSVAHGKVRVERRGEVLTLTNGQSWSTNRTKREPVPPQVAQLFERGPHHPAAAASSLRPASSIERTPAAPPSRSAVPATPAPTAATPIAPVTAASLYRLAESALQRGDDARGQQLLSELVARFPADPAADAARFEMALIFEKTGKAEKALALTDEIVRGRSKGPFVEPARLLRCRLPRTHITETARADCAAK